jgi:glycine C-acetyltransferase
MPNTAFATRSSGVIESLTDTGQLKPFYNITSPMRPVVEIEGKGEVLVLCSNNYLGLADHPEVIQAGIQGLQDYGAGTASVRFICGTLKCHRDLEDKIARFLGTEASLSYVSCWNANEAVFPTLVAPEDAILSDELNHASIIDGMRLMNKNVTKKVYRHSDMEQLEALLKETQSHPVRWVVTDGVFSMEGDVARLPQMAELCKEYNAMLVVDDSHGVGVLGKTGRGTHEHYGIESNHIDVFTGTLGKALGGAAGGYVAASRDAISTLEQKARPSLFSNALPATVAYSAGKAIDLVDQDPGIVARLHTNVKKIRDGLAKRGFDCTPSPTAIIPIMIGDEAEAIKKSARLFEMGVMVIGFGFPVVPRGEARLRVQVSAALTDDHIQQALDAFARL